MSTPVQVHALCAADEYARDHRAAILAATERAMSAMYFDMLPLARERLTQALAALDGLEERLTELEAQR